MSKALVDEVSSSSTETHINSFMVKNVNLGWQELCHREVGAKCVGPRCEVDPLCPGVQHNEHEWNWGHWWHRKPADHHPRRGNQVGRPDCWFCLQRESEGEVQCMVSKELTAYKCRSQRRKEKVNSHPVSSSWPTLTKMHWMGQEMQSWVIHCLLISLYMFLSDEINLATAEVEDHVTYCAWWRPTGSSVFIQDDSCSGGSMDFNGVFTAMRAGIYQVWPFFSHTWFSPLTVWF